jgi:hypothetical protein
MDQQSPSPGEAKHGSCPVGRWLPKVTCGLALAAVAGGLGWLWLGSDYPLLIQLLYTAPVVLAALLIGGVRLAVAVGRRQRPAIVWGTGVTAAVCGVAGWLAYNQFLQPPPQPDETVRPLVNATWSCDALPQPMPRIPAGTSFVKEPPPGWSHLILKVMPRYRPDGSSRVPAMLTQVINLFFFAFLAQVERTDADPLGPFVLVRIGVGVGVSGEGTDRICAANEEGKLGEQDGLLFRGALRSAEKDIATARRMARTPNLWVFDTPVRVAYKQTGALITRRFAVYAGRQDGRLTTLFWELAQGPNDAYVPDETAVYRLPPGLIQEMPLVVNEGIASLVALFSIGGRPTSTPFSLPAEWRAELNQPRLLAQTVRRLEEELARRLGAEGEK